MDRFVELSTGRQLVFDHITACVIILIGLVYVARRVWVTRRVERDRAKRQGVLMGKSDAQRKAEYDEAVRDMNERAPKAPERKPDDNAEQGK